MAERKERLISRKRVTRSHRGCRVSEPLRASAVIPFSGCVSRSSALPVMGVFDSKPLNSTPLNSRLRNNPLLFGVPFVIIMVVASYALVPFTQTKYELQDRKISKVRPINILLPQAEKRRIQHEIFRLQKSKNLVWRTEGENLTSARSTL